ncbi:hypothetical protein V6N13_029757 [Hibiscus sabdariffa]
MALVDWRKLFSRGEDQSLECFPAYDLELIKLAHEVFDEGIPEWRYALVGQFIDNGPWHIQHKLLVLRKWESNLRKLDFDLSHMLVWVQLYNVPLELYSRKGLSHIASGIGVPLYMDVITAYKEHLEFAKVCVELEAGAKIPKSNEG